MRTRKNISTIVMMAMLVTALLTSCIHRYPEGIEENPGIDPTKVLLTFEIETDQSEQSIETLNRLMSRLSSDSIKQRYIVEMSRQGSIYERQVYITGIDTSRGTKVLTLPYRMQAHAVEYDVAVWSDYVVGSTLHYDTEDINDIQSTLPHIGNSDLKLCHYANCRLDLRPYREVWNAQHTVKMATEKPVAKYRIVSSDVQKYLKRAARIGSRADGVNIKLVYNNYFPISFNPYTGCTGIKVEGIEYSSHVDFSQHPDSDEIELAFDYIFADEGENRTSVSLIITNPAGKVISRFDDIGFSYEAGKVTTIRGNFLTPESSGGIEINDEWDGEIIIEI